MQCNCFEDHAAEKVIAGGGWTSQLSLPASFATMRTCLTVERMYRGHVYEVVLSMDVNKVTDAAGFLGQGSHGPTWITQSVCESYLNTTKTVQARILAACKVKAGYWKR